MDIVIPRQQDLDDLDAKTALADYTGAKLHLFSNDITPNRDTVLADLTETLASGVVGQVVTWSVAFFDPEGNPVSTIGELLFIQTGATNGDVFGAYLTNGASNKLLWSARLDPAPFHFIGIGTTLPLTAKMGLAGGEVNITA